MNEKSFMFTATTNLVAGTFENEDASQNHEETKDMVITSLQLAVIVGIIFGLALGGSAPLLLRTLLGQKQSANLEVMSAAQRYVQIRALGMPASVAIGSAQSACLGMKDIRSPLLVMVAAAVVNFLGDAAFVRNTNPWIGGAAGAAWATVISQYVALGLFLRWLRMRPDNGGKDIDADKRSMGSDVPSAALLERKKKDMKKKKAFSTKGLLNGRLKKRDLLKLPSSINTAKKFWPYVIPVTTASIGKVSGYIAMSHVVSSVLGTVDMAAQQIVLAFFLCFIPMCDSLNLTAQSFVPGIYEYKGDAKVRSAVLRKTVINFIKAGGIFGGVLTGIVACMPLISKLFTRDASVIASVNSTTPFFMVIFAMSGLVCGGEGNYFIMLSFFDFFFIY